MERIISSIVDGMLLPFVNGLLIPFIEGGGAFVVFALLWGSFGYALIARPEGVHDAWQAITSLPLAVQLALWLVFLPIVAALWIWETTWPVVVRLISVVGLAGWSLMIFLPKWLTASRG